MYAVSLLASGQSSTVTGTYAGQYIMQVHFTYLLQLLFFFVQTMLSDAKFSQKYKSFNREKFSQFNMYLNI